MFDGLETVADPVAEDPARLKRRFDPLLRGEVSNLDPQAEEELRLLARIHDLDDGTPPTLLWGALRGRLDALVEPASWDGLARAA